MLNAAESAPASFRTNSTHSTHYTATMAMARRGSWMTCGWRHHHTPACCPLAKSTSPTAWTGRHRRVADSPIPPPTFHDQFRIPTAAGGARGQRCTTHSHTATHHHHTSPPPTPSALGGNHDMQQAADWGNRPRRPLAAGAPPSQLAAQQQQRTSARHVPSSRHRLTGSRQVTNTRKTNIGLYVLRRATAQVHTAHNGGECMSMGSPLWVGDGVLDAQDGRSVTVDPNDDRLCAARLSNFRRHRQHRVSLVRQSVHHVQWESCILNTY